MDKISIKLPNGAEFSAEGDQDKITALFEQFMAAAATAPAAPLPPAPAAAGTGATVNGAGALDTDLMRRLFATDDYAGVSLLVTPTGENANLDALMAILYGFAKLLNETSPTAIRLMRAATKSGLNVPRLDRVLKGEPRYVTTSGRAKGQRYGLTNPGMARAEEILKGVLG